MPVNSQQRPFLDTAVQQTENLPIATMVSQQIVDTITASTYTMPVDADRFPVDTTAADCTFTVPLATDLIKGKPYIIEKVAGANDIVVTLSGTDEFEGETTLTISETDAPFVFISDGTTLRRAGAGAPPTAEGALADRIALGLNKVYLPIRVATLVGTGVYRITSPYAGTITGIRSIIEGVLTTGNATLTGKIGSTAITDGVITITQVSSAAGDQDSATPSAANVVAQWDEISLTVGGTNATATVANCWVEITLS